MKVNHMRMIDRWVGIPLCFLLSLLLKIGRPWRKAPPSQPQKTLFIELSEMGSAILVDPALRYHRKKTKADLFFVIFRKNRPSLELLGTVPRDNVFTIREDNFFFLVQDTLRFLLWVRRKGIDSVVDLELFSRFTALLTILCGAGLRVGFHGYHNEGLYRGSFLTHRVWYNPYRHITENFLALVCALESPPGEIPLTKAALSRHDFPLAKVNVPEEKRLFLQDIVGKHYPSYDARRHRLVLVNPNASELLRQRRWPQKNYRDLIAMILASGENILVLITGDPRERAEAQELKAAVDNARCVNFAGAIEFLDLPALYSISEFMVTNDSGPAHFAAITNLPTYVFFGPETPSLYGSLGETTPIYAHFACSPCVSAYNHRHTPCEDNQCLQAITPKEVLAIIRPALEKLR
jgi:ADP-heptose:LPS heptosyltransferase